MKTELIDVKNIEDITILQQNIKSAAKDLLKGALVAFPTETVYGLGANALDKEAVSRIYKAKGRPQDNPLIIHISSKDMLEKYVVSIPKDAEILMEKFWPGPLTIILKKNNTVPLEVTAGLDTVAVRMPSNIVALELIKLSKVPIAAPSANVSGKPSPTSFQDVKDDLFGKVAYIIDGGRCNVGVESTVIDMTRDKPVILRPGGISSEQIKIVLPSLEMNTNMRNYDKQPKSPGMKYTHYSPNAKVILISGSQNKVIEKINEMIDEYEKKKIKVGIMVHNETKQYYHSKNILITGSKENPETIARELFYNLREFDRMEVDIILAEELSNHGIGEAIMNRLFKAAGEEIIYII